MTFSRLFANTIMKPIMKQPSIPQCYYKNKVIVLSKNRINSAKPKQNRNVNRNKNSKQF